MAVPKEPTKRAGPVPTKRMVRTTTPAAATSRLASVPAATARANAGAGPTRRLPRVPPVRRDRSAPEKVGPTSSQEAQAQPEAKTRATSAAKGGRLSTPAGDEIIASVKQAQQLVLDAVTAWADVIGQVIPKLPYSSSWASVSSDLVDSLGAAFEVAQELLASQRRSATEVAKVLVPVS